MSYSEFVRSKFKPGHKIAAEMTPHKSGVLWFRCRQFIGECNDLDAAKKYTIYNKPTGDDYFVGDKTLEKFANFKPTPQQAELLHAAIGIAGEAGELLDTVRKHVFDGHDLDLANCIEEMGDIGFFFEAMLQVLDVDRAYIEAVNQAKLSRRYEAGYSDKAAQERADKAGEE